MDSKKGNDMNELQAIPPGGLYPEIGEGPRKIKMRVRVDGVKYGKIVNVHTDEEIGQYLESFHSSVSAEVGRPVSIECTTPEDTHVAVAKWVEQHAESITARNG